jgi:signal transduction histidine kinase
MSDTPEQSLEQLQRENALLQEEVRNLGLVQSIASDLPSPPVLSDTVAAIGRILRRALPGVDLALFFLHHAPSETLAMMGGDWSGDLTLDMRSLSIGISEKAPLTNVFDDGNVLSYKKSSDQNAAAWSTDALHTLLDPGAIYYLPLSVEHGRIGVLALAGRERSTLNEGQRHLADLLSGPISIAVERSRLYEKLRSANEKLEQINKLKNEFISMVSHELRTPLTTIKGFVSIVLNEETGPLNDQQRHFLKTSDRAIDRLTLLVSDLLDISRIEAGQIKMQLRPVALDELFSRAAMSFMPQFKAQSLILTLNIPDHLPAVLADPERIGQVLDNLLTNALKFTTRGGITLTASDKGDYVMVSVKDTGVGIPVEEQDKIFEKFYQIKTGSGWPSKGTGLGLAIVRSIVESHRGKVWVEGEAGQGADFRFILPRARMEPAEDIPTTGVILS